MEDDNRFSECVVTEGDRIIFTGDLTQAENMYGTELVRHDLMGHTLMPSFIDPHSHFVSAAQSIQTCDLSGADDFHDIVGLLRDYVRRNNLKDDGVIYATGYDHNFLREKCHPDKELLDSVSTRMPIYISHISGHMGVGNSALFERAGITCHTPDPEGGRFGRNADGSLNGYVEETSALFMILKALPPMQTDMMKQLELAQQMYLQHGVTTVQEGAAGADTLKLLMEFEKTGKLIVDVKVYVLDDEYGQAGKRFTDDCTGIRKVQLGGSKIILDGSPQGKSAWLSLPYEGDGEYCGYPTHDDEYVENAARKAITGHYQLLAHCNGDAASEQFIRCYGNALKKEGSNDDLRPVMIHCQTVRNDQLDRMVKLGMLPSVFVGHTYYWGDIHLKNLGMLRGSNISPVKEMQNRGMIYNFHQDTPVTKPDMLHSVWCALNRMTRNGQNIGHEQCIDVYDALKAVTINAAYEYHEEDIKGTLSVGKRADMVILSGNPLAVPIEEIREIAVLATIKNGEVVFRDEKLSAGEQRET
jgi:hypothetical protein